MKGIDKYGQMGRAALLPGLAYAIEILEGRAGELRAEIAEIEGSNQGINGGVPKKKLGRPEKVLIPGLTPADQRNAAELERVTRPVKKAKRTPLPEKIDDKYLVTPLAEKLGYSPSSGGWGLVLQLRQHKIPMVRVPHPTIASLTVNAITEAGYQRLMKARGA